MWQGTSHCNDAAKRAVISAYPLQSKQRIQYMNQSVRDCGVTCEELCGY